MDKLMPDLYIFDTNSFRVIENYYPESFPSFWEKLESLIRSNEFSSCWEVRKELEQYSPTEHLLLWVASHPDLFPKPSEEEMIFVAEIFKIQHFHQLIGEKQRLKGAPVADPFLVARGKALDACVVSEETYKPNAAKIPNVCRHFDIKCIKVQEFLSEVGWVF